MALRMELKIAVLQVEQSAELSKMLLAERSEYGQYFQPFSYEAEALADRLAKAQYDKYWGIWCQDELAGFFMLRGFDKRYERPAFGVYVAEQFANCGLAKLAMQYALSWCRLNQIKAIILKVHPDNKNARHIYDQAGFTFIGVYDQNGHHILEKRWN